MENEDFNFKLFCLASLGVCPAVGKENHYYIEHNFITYFCF